MVSQRYSINNGKITDSRNKESGLQTLYIGPGPRHSVSLKGSESAMKKRGMEYYNKGWDVIVGNGYMTATINVEIDKDCNPMSSPNLFERMGSYTEK